MCYNNYELRVIILLNNNHVKFADMLITNIFNYKELDFLKMNLYNFDIINERKQFNMYKSGNGVIDLPFVGILKNNVIIKGFYKEDTNFNIDYIIKYLLHLSKNMVVDILINGDVPSKESGNSGYDLKADLNLLDKSYLVNCEFRYNTLVIDPGGRCLVPTGINISMPEGYEAQIRPRSGLALKHGISILNTPGTIDANYRGDVGIILINHGNTPFIINNGDRIAQLVFIKIENVEFNQVSTLDTSDRGEKGFGSSGVK